MRSAETVLGIIRNRGTRGLPVNEPYRQLWNPNLYLMAYGRIAKNDGALTPGATPETAAGMKMDDIHAIIEALRFERRRRPRREQPTTQDSTAEGGAEQQQPEALWLF